MKLNLPTELLNDMLCNVIDNNMYAQLDDKGNMFQLLDEIMDHK